MLEHRPLWFRYPDFPTLKSAQISVSCHCLLLLDPNHHCLQVWENWASAKHACPPVHERALNRLRWWWPAVINKCQPNWQALNLMARQRLASSQLFILPSPLVRWETNDASAFRLNYKGLQRECHFFTSKQACLLLFIPCKLQEHKWKLQFTLTGRRLDCAWKWNFGPNSGEFRKAFCELDSPDESADAVPTN